jgi:hypothetical protein
MERSAIRGVKLPGFAALHPGYKRRFPSRDFHQHIVYDCGAAAIFRAAEFHACEKIFADYQP